MGADGAGLDARRRNCENMIVHLEKSLVHLSNAIAISSPASLSYAPLHVAADEVRSVLVRMREQVAALTREIDGQRAGGKKG